MAADLEMPAVTPTFTRLKAIRRNGKLSLMIEKRILKVRELLSTNRWTRLIAGPTKSNPKEEEKRLFA